MTTASDLAPPVAHAQTEKLRGPALGLLVVLCAAFFLDALDTSMVAVALPSIQGALHMWTSDLQWIVSGYVLGYGGFLLLGGRAADLLGRRRVFLIALTGFVLMSGLGGIATSGGLLIASRFLKGISAACTAPAGLSIILASFPEGPTRNKALAAYSSTGAAGFTFGLISGGLLGSVSWRLVFFMPTVVAALTLLGAVRLIPAEEASTVTRKRMDLPGAVSVTAAMMLLVYTLTEAPTLGWGSARTVLSLIGFAVLVVAFVLIERGNSSPLLPLPLLRSWTRIHANLGAMVFVGGWASAQFIATLYMQETRHWSAIETAAAFWPCGVLGLFVAPRIESMIRKVGLRQVLTIGLVLTVVCYALLIPIGMQSNYWLALFPSFALIRIAFALVFSTLSIGATTDVAEHEHGIASGLFQTSTQFGTAVLIAVTTAVNEVGLRPGSPAGMLHGYHTALYVPLLASIVILLLTAAGLRGRRALQTI
jgi:MFS family permease